ncbi:hypothetical protein GCM10022252_39700 [Streptosporangium oxazolinicum]|uniref:Uncharacterized protein n=1 Tax=Streptosporangium oxazolinicum TaxID=909287 RepID=A0ABP8B041_9ACTN
MTISPSPNARKNREDLLGGEGNVVVSPTFPADKNERDLTKKYVAADRFNPILVTGLIAEWRTI